MTKHTWTQNLGLQMDFWRRWLWLTLPQLFIMMLFRLLAISLYSHWGSVLNQPRELTQALWIGLKFDFSTLCYLVTLPFLAGLGFSFAPALWRSRFFSHVSRWYFWASWMLLILCLVGDLGYYSYFQDHINVLVFGLFEDDTRALLVTFWKNYPLLKGFVALVLFAWLSLRYINWVFTRVSQSGEAKVLRQTLWALLIPLGVSLGARGSLGLFPLSVQDTVVSSNSFINYLSYNGFHALIRATRLKSKQSSNWDSNLKRFGYSDPKQAFADFFQINPSQVPENPLDLLHHRTATNTWAQQVRPHVLVIMMESFGSGYLDFSTPEFDLTGELAKHFNQDFLFKNFLPSHGSTIGSLSTFMISAPQKPEAGFLTETEFLQVPFRSSAARVFSQAGYQTHFIYGGNPGWRDINKFAKFQGFDQVEGEVDIEKANGRPLEKHDWGVFDEDVFKYILADLAAAKEPQFYLAMTTTNHPPYQLPQSWSASHAQNPLQLPEALSRRLTVDPDLALQRFKVYQYSNHILGQLLSRIKNSPLKDRLIVAITGDHSFWMINFTDQEFFKKWGVPFYVYLPPGLSQHWRNHFDPQTFGSHMDIFPTLYEMALSQVAYDSLGTDLFSANTAKAGSWSVSSNQYAFTDHIGVQIHGQDFSPLQLQNQNISPSDLSAAHATLFNRYKGLMGVLDVYLSEEKKHTPHVSPLPPGQKDKQ